MNTSLHLVLYKVEKGNIQVCGILVSLGGHWMCETCSLIFHLANQSKFLTLMQHLKSWLMELLNMHLILLTSTALKVTVPCYMQNKLQSADPSWKLFSLCMFLLKLSKIQKEGNKCLWLGKWRTRGSI